MTDLLIIKAEELQKFAELENTELGELWASLIAVAYHSEYASDDFAKALENEIDAQLDHCKKHATIVEEEETFTRKVVSLEWDD